MVYLFWFSTALTVFALSRSLGHIGKHPLIMTGYPQVWKSLSPFSGAVNTFTFILIASVTVFFQHFQRLYRRMSANHAELETFSRDILNLNKDLETMVMERTMAEMALGVADGIRNPICVIGGFSRLLLKRLDPDNPTREWLTTIAAETKRMEEMVTKFESLAEKREYFFGQEDLNQVVETTLTMLAPEFQAKEIDLQTSLWPEPLMGKINGHLLRVALSHLLRNAIEATPRAGSISLTTQMAGELARLEIRTPAGAWLRRWWNRFLRPFTPPRSAAPAWVWSSSARSSKNTGAASESKAKSAGAPRSSSTCPNAFPPSKAQISAGAITSLYPFSQVFSL